VLSRLALNVGNRPIADTQSCDRTLRMRLRVALWTLLVWAAFPGASATASAARCMNGLTPALIAGGFSGSVDCQHDHLSVRYVGQLRRFGRTFKIYSNHYKLKPVCPECAIHGGHRILFMERGHYVGQYRSDFVQAIIRHGNLVLVPTDRSDPACVPVTVNFTRNGPPKELWADCEIITFFR
jgi:hypothetical protein